MGIFDFFSGQPSDSAIQSQITKAKERYAQPDYRRMAMEKLLKWDTDQSLKGVLQRFLVVVQSPHWDETEKQWLVGELVARKERVKDILTDFILKEDDLAYALDAYKKIVLDDKRYEEMLLLALEHRPPSDHRSIRAKQVLLSIIADMPSINRAIFVPYLDDHSDDVQCEAIRALTLEKNEQFFAPLVKLISADDHSSRVMREAASALERLHAPMPTDASINPIVLEDFEIKDGLLKKR